MRPAIFIALLACLVGGAAVAVSAEELEGTLKKIKESGTITIGHRDSSVPLSYLDDKLQPVGFSIDLCRHVVEAVKAKLAMPNLNVAYNPVTSATRIPLVANGTVDVECGSTANMTARQKQVGFSYTFFVPQFKWIVRANSGINAADDLRGKSVAVTAGTNTAIFVNKLNNEGKLGMNIMQGKDHAESFLLVETGRASAWMEDDVLIVSHKATLRVITCALLGLDVRLFRERIAQPVSAVTMFVVVGGTAMLTVLGDRAHLSEELKNQEGT